MAKVHVFVGNYKSGTVMDRVVDEDEREECVDDLATLLGYDDCVWASFEKPNDAANRLIFADYMTYYKEH